MIKQKAELFRSFQEATRLVKINKVWDKKSETILNNKKNKKHMKIQNSTFAGFSLHHCFKLIN